MLLLTALVVLNSSADVRVPLQVTVGGQSQDKAVTTSQPVFDAATVTTLAGLGTAFIYRWKKSDKRAEKFNDRTVVGAETTMTQAESLKQTDVGIADTLGALNKAIGLIPGVPPEATKLISQQLEAWQKDNQAYYENNPAKKTDLSSDPVIKKLGEVQKISEKNE